MTWYSNMIKEVKKHGLSVTLQSLPALKIPM